VITVANLVPVKGIEVLIQAIQMLDQDKVKLLIVGDYNNPYGEWMKNTYENNRIQFVGKQMDVRPYLALADVFVIPTKNEGRREGLPIALLEAMASGKIALGSNVSGIKDILGPFPQHLFEADRVDDLKHKLLSIKNMGEEERTHLGLQMAEHVQNAYNIPQFVNNHEQLYLKLTSLP
jgi:glycosyltransferase involved in cell wall biosynthesis